MIDLTASDSETSVSSNAYDEDVTYSRWKRQLVNCLDGITSSGDFCVSRQYRAFPNPCLRIAGRAAVIPLPVTDHDADSIRGACREAPFGRGDETLVDTSVRKTWELDATHFQCTNPSWPEFFQTLLDDVAAGLGLPDVHAKPHKLLLYEKGSFFKKHKDSEKEVGMIATLVICLPATHRGGDVHLSFGSDSRVIATAPASPFDVTALAWFSDVDHEVKPLNFGHRLVLTYKLFQSGDVKQSAKFLIEQSQQLKNILTTWQAKFSYASMLTYPLEHKYTQSSLSLKNMKGRDRAVCHSLKEISAACGVYLVLGHMTGTEDEDVDYYDMSGDGEISITLDTIYSCDGAQIGSGHAVDESEILGGSSIFKDRAPDSEDEGEFTGNESAPSSFRYHDSVAVLIPKQQIHQFLRTNLYQGNHNGEAENLLYMVKQDFKEHPESLLVKASTLRVMTTALDISAQSIKSTMASTVAQWALETNHEDLYRKALKTALSCREFPTELLDVVSHFLEESFAKDQEDVDWGKWLGPLLHSTSLMGWYSASRMFTARLKNNFLRKSFSRWSQPQLDVKIDTQPSFAVTDHDFFLNHIGQAVASDRITLAFISRGTRELIFKVLNSIFQRRAQLSDDVVRSIFETTLGTARSKLVLQAKDLPAGAYWGSTFHGKDETRAPCQQFVALIQQSLAIGVSHQAIELLEESHKTLSDAIPSWDRSSIRKDHLARDLLAPLASALQSSHISLTPDVTGLFELLIRHVLHYKVPTYPKKLRGWRHKRRGCGPGVACADCNAMNAFLDSEQQQTWSFSAAERRRRHVEANLPYPIFRTETVRSRSPYTLVVHKLGKEHVEELRKFHQNLKDFERALAPLQGDIFAGILGDAIYRELILLEELKNGLPSESYAGVKRPSESNDAGDSVRQRR